MNNKEEIFQKLYSLVKKAAKKDSVPIAAIISNKKGEIIGIGQNKTNKNIVTSHAEIYAINQACKKIKASKLQDCTIWITVEPCMMCLGAIVNAGIKKINYYLENEKFGFVKSNHTFDLSKMAIHKINDNKEKNDLKNIMQGFFLKLR
ncbi:deaminase [Spiroplasma chrysopicola]|uniref:tRNA-specific adenosine deaminase n=1 Tax=Spiroplasma chrysopicola DF-1 TaxID=1276227 RepID=R4U2C1_9MOLU|nr:deaminase [Spiroplasma chrysopicola]AGM24593.1 tRNA-specific adenosine deaminase [Spiroplasma chrysopicola DF-1]